MSSALIAKLPLSAQGCGTVSYTHLDVYKRQVHGCESLVWLVAERRDGRLHFRAGSDARLLRGLLAVLLVRVEGLPRAELASVDLVDWFEQLGLQRQLSPSRSNGLNAVLQRMRELAES